MKKFRDFNFRKIHEGAMVIKGDRAWGVVYQDGRETVYGWKDPGLDTLHDCNLEKPTDLTYKGSHYIDELEKGVVVRCSVDIKVKLCEDN